MDSGYIDTEVWIMGILTLTWSFYLILIHWMILGADSEVGPA